MLISLNWIRDFVDLPDDLDPVELAERFTRTTAEVEGVEPIRIAAKGLVAARIERVETVADSTNLHQATLRLSQGETAETVSAAPGLKTGQSVVYAPPGACVEKLGCIETARIAGRTSTGMILPGEAIGVAMAVGEPIFLNPKFEPGQALPADLFDDWVIEVDNKSITHRPDLWGHYGIAREIAAILGLPLKPYPVVPLDELQRDGLAALPISIAAPEGCRRYSGIVLAGVPTQPAPLWMQLRLGHVGLRPISGLVDLTNYIMADLGQPMHAFDAAKVDRIEVDWASDGEKFCTLDGSQRSLTSEMLMIRSSGRSVAVAGVMGGRDAEVTETTGSLLLESANFDAATIRRTAGALGLRTDASARFEKSLDPAHTALSIQRFIHLARPEYPELTLVSRLSDAYPAPQSEINVRVSLREINRTIGRAVELGEIDGALAPLGFSVSPGDGSVAVTVPSFRATGDVSIEADVIEEIARRIGFDAAKPEMPRVSVRSFKPNELRRIERHTLEYLATAHTFHEIHGYIWYDGDWLAQLGIDSGPCIELRNPASQACSRLRRSLMPGMLAAVVRNRFYISAFSLMELGSVFEPKGEQGHEAGQEYRHVALLVARRGKNLEEQLHEEIKGAIGNWSVEVRGRQVSFESCDQDPLRPWEHPHRTAAVVLDGVTLGKVSVVNLPLRRAMDEHLESWSIAWAELGLDSLATLPAVTETIGVIPEHPLVEMDFSILVPKATRYAEVREHLRTFRHPLLKHVRYVTAYEGGSIPQTHRSLTFRTVIGHDARTLEEADTTSFRGAFESHLKSGGYQWRG